jgi:hypothetical protein
MRIRERSDVKRFLLVLLLNGLATLPAWSVDAVNEPVATKGTMLFSADGGRLGPVYRVTSDGAAQIIIDGKMTTVPAATISSKDGKLTTSLKKTEVLSLK